MRLPYDILSESYRKPSAFLCETDKTRICELETVEMSAAFKFNAYSELTFTVPRTYTNMITGETQVNPYYNKIEALRLIYLENFGYFEIQDPEIISDGVREVKEVTAYSLDYTLSQKYLDGIKINTGEVDSTEVVEAGNGGIVPVTLYNFAQQNLSLIHIILEKVYGWSIGYIDSSLATMSRTFEISRVSVYDFIVQDICDKFNCFAVFDTINNTISLYSEALITKYIGDGITTTFSTPYETISAVTIDSYRTTAYTYDMINKYIVFDVAPENGARIEITDGSQSEWLTDVYVTFDNLAQEVNVSYSADDIKTVLTVKGADDMDIRNVNMGLPYIVDLSYYYSADWMGQELYDVYTKYLQTYNAEQERYELNAKDMITLYGYIDYEQNRLSLQYSIADNVTSTTQGTYYVRGGSSPNYYYTEVSLPSEYDASVEHYYMRGGTDLDEEKFSNLYAALQTYFVSQDQKDVSAINELENSFSFMNTDESKPIEKLSNTLSAATNLKQKDTAVLEFLDKMWNQIGLTPLDTLYYKSYKNIETSNIESGWDNTSNVNYWRYYPVTLVLKSITNEKTERETTIKGYQDQYDALQEENQEITTNASMDVYFNKYYIEQGLNSAVAEKKAAQLLVRISAFLREDEYTDDSFEELSTDTNESIIQKQKALLESGRVELEKLCSPKLEFSMNMANIYALHEFEPIIDQFKLGNFINVVIRNDYIKRARLLEVDINFDDFSDFSCSFGELTNLKTPSSIHADLLANALTAGKSVASNASYWNKGVETATQLDLAIQEGLISAIGGLYNKDQSVVIDDMGILLRKVNEDGSFSPYQAWLRNNTILLSEDGFSETSQPSLGLGEFVIDGQTSYGILAKAVLSGYIEGSTIVGGTVNIGDGTFAVDQFGNVTMNAATINGYATSDDLDSLSSRITATEEGIETKVSKDSVISTINQSAESVAIDADKISLTGKTIDLTSDNITISSTNFSVTKDGKITATSGEIAGWNINTSTFYKTTTVDDVDYNVYIQASSKGGNYNAFCVRTKASSVADWDAQFYVTYAGKMIAKNAVIYGSIYASEGEVGGFTLDDNKMYSLSSNGTYTIVNGTNYAFIAGAETLNNVGTAPFRVTHTGELHSTSGKIGGWNIGTSKIYGTADTGNVAVMQLPTSSTTYVFAAGGTSHSSYTDCPFRVTKAGKLYASDAVITGEINATSGTLANWTINANRITVQNNDGTYNSINNSTGSSYAFVAGAPSLSDSTSAPFRVTHAGKLYATNAVISGDSTIAAACIPDLSASKITSGTISTDRLSSSVITTDNFSSKSLSTGNLSVTGGSTLGYWTVTSSGGLTCGSGESAVGLSSAGVSHGSGWTASWYDIIQAGNSASDERLKTDIIEFESCYDNIFDNLKPVQFRYNIDPDRLRLGFIAQDVKANFEAEGINNFGGVYMGDGDDNYYRLIKEDFIALNTWQIQKLKNRVEELEAKLTVLEA